MDVWEPRRSIGYPKLALRAVVWTSERVLCGTERGEVVEVNPAQHASPVMVCQGHPAHKGELWGLACHPTALVFASASEDKTVHVWDMKTHAVVASAQLPEQARAAAFSADGGHLAVGMKKGRLVVLDAEHALASVVTVAKRKEVRLLSASVGIRCAHSNYVVIIGGMFSNLCG